jgi:flagellar protein FlbD
MIKLTRLNGQTFILNAIYLEQIQAFPDTTITLTNGKKVFVKESEEVVRQAVANFYKEVSLIRLNEIKEGS